MPRRQTSSAGTRYTKTFDVSGIEIVSLISTLKDTVSVEESFLTYEQESTISASHSTDQDRQSSIRGKASRTTWFKLMTQTAGFAYFGLSD